MFHGISTLLPCFFSHLGFWSGNPFLIAPFPDLCLLVPFPVPCFTHVLFFWNKNAHGPFPDLCLLVPIPIPCFTHVIFVRIMADLVINLQYSESSNGKY